MCGGRRCLDSDDRGSHCWETPNNQPVRRAHTHRDLHNLNCAIICEQCVHFAWTELFFLKPYVAYQSRGNARLVCFYMQKNGRSGAEGCRMLCFLIESIIFYIRTPQSVSSHLSFDHPFVPSARC